MPKSSAHPPYSASVLSDFAGCRYIMYLDRLSETQDIRRAEDDEGTKITQVRGYEHEKKYLDKLERDGNHVLRLSNPPIKNEDDRLELRQATIDALSKGAPYIYQPYLYSAPFHGYADFLKRVDRPSKLGNFSYEVIDTKLSKREKNTHIIQLCLYSELLGDIQGALPERIHIVTGDSQLRSFRVYDYLAYYRRLKSDFLAASNSTTPSELYPEPCYRCSICRWREYCADKRQQDDHLSLVANISRGQRVKLAAHGITTCAQLADSGTPVPDSIPRSIFERLQEQAALQKTAEKTGIPTYKCIHPNKGGRGFTMLPPLNEGDLFYDIEADPHVKESTSNPALLDGLQYLHGFSWRKPDGTFEYRAFWALTKREERRCFEEVMDFIGERLRLHPGAMIYHYSSYETCALKKLSAQYPTRVDELDDLLRQQKFCDLYTVVKQSIRVSEPRYSIKNLERFYSAARDHAVTGSGTSIVWFEKYLESKDTKYLDDLQDYNQKDCDSMIELYDWLSERKNESARAFGVNWDTLARKETPEPKESNEASSSDTLSDAERIDGLRALLRIDELQDNYDTETHTDEEMLRLRLFLLADFHRREMKPLWWNHYARKDLTTAERLESGEILAQATLDPKRPPEPIRKSTLLHFTFPPQEAAFKKGDKLWDIDGEQSFGTIEDIDLDQGTLSIAVGSVVEWRDRVQLVDLSKPPSDPSRALKKSIDRCIASIADFDLSTLRTSQRSYPYAALVDFILKDRPVFLDGPRSKVVSVGADDPSFREKLTDAALSLDRSYLLIQGPPGTGKTFHGARMAVSLMRIGKKIGVMSNSHKAICNFLEEVDKVAHRERLTFKGIKVSEKTRPETHYEKHRHPEAPTAQITDWYDKSPIVPEEYNLIAGTAWVFSREVLDQQLDYLVIDEASQLSLANLLAAGVSASNLILIGDPCQLPQPLQGVHPEEMDLSPLQYILGDHATVPPDLGVFLEVCRRMHTDICDLLSRQVYDSRLLALPENAHQRILPHRSFSLPREAGFFFHPVEHDGNTNSSPEEAVAVASLYQQLLTCHFRDKDKREYPITPSDIMVIAPYNMQVAQLRERLPHADIGTIDKFQGREAPVVLASMATSSLEETPRGLDFLFSPKRLNVLLSRAKALVIVVGSPKLFESRCSSPEQMKLLSFFYALQE